MSLREGLQPRLTQPMHNQALGHVIHWTTTTNPQRTNDISVAPHRITSNF